MKMAMKDGQLIIIEVDSTQFQVIKSWGKMKWNKSYKSFTGSAEIELLNKLAEVVRLPPNIEAERQRLNRIAQAVDTERMNEAPVPLVKYPVKMDLYKHQIRGANMAMLTFGLVEPKGVKLDADE